MKVNWIEAGVQGDGDFSLVELLWWSISVGKAVYIFPVGVCNCDSFLLGVCS